MIPRAPETATILPELPARVPPDAIDVVLSRHRGDLDAFFAELAARGGVLVTDDPGTGTATVCVAHPRTDPRTEVIMLIDTITHMRRDQLEHFVLAPYTAHGAELLAAAFVLPRALRATISLLAETNRDPALVRDRQRWRAVYGRTRALSGHAETVREDVGGRASVLALPGAPARAWAEPEATGAFTAPPDAAHRHPRAAEVHRHRMDSAALGLPMRVWAAVPHPAHGAPSAVVAVADGHRWADGYPVLHELERLHDQGACAPTLALFFSPEDSDRRAEVLGMHPRLPAFLTEELLPWAVTFAHVPSDPARRAIAGASLGGLAAADVVRRAPEVFGNAVVQSGSFWWPDSDGVAGAQLRLWQAEAAGLASRVRLFHEVGDQEGHLLEENRAFRDLLREHAVPIHFREYVGGHDLACWRIGLLDALTHLFPLTPTPPARQGALA